MPSARDRLISLVMIGPSSSKHCLRIKVGIGWSGHCLLDDDKMSWRTSERVAGRKFKSLVGGVGGKEKGSGEVGAVNEARMRSILSVKNSRKALASVVVIGSSERELIWLRWRIELRDFQRERGFLADSDTRLDRKVDFALVTNLCTILHWDRNRIYPWCSRCDPNDVQENFGHALLREFEHLSRA